MTKTFKIVVLAKQVPDTRNVGKNAMKEDGTVNRAALPAIFNPEDLLPSFEPVIFFSLNNSNAITSVSVSLRKETLKKFKNPVGFRQKFPIFTLIRNVFSPNSISLKTGMQ